jgi:hypothetical protein
MVIEHMNAVFSFILLGLWAARLELFKFLFFMSFGVFLWSIYMLIEASGSSSRKSKKRNAMLLVVVSSVVLIGMAATWLLSKTNIGWWFE